MLSKNREQAKKNIEYEISVWAVNAEILKRLVNLIVILREFSTANSVSVFFCCSTFSRYKCHLNPITPMKRWRENINLCFYLTDDN